ncbi:CHAT domain-containing protein [Kineosporia sp. NBRC 101731]|uniref:CHAT domain-containing protein n=1 Tax=Kineosporia sp. NBRC 101731 TaxID=3032199 RepID=UPI00249FAD10|nr:CHAT domain-containing protein [Kineosporia sp. NBRC 101731]GLY28968.1 hypothetical protein Kisp02_23330 [Kineosporia sp. NBRC 101731]
MAKRDPGALNDDAVALWDRYDLLGDVALLETAITRLRTALSLRHVEPTTRLSLQANLSGTLTARALRTGSPDDLLEAANLARDVVAATPPHDPRHLGRQTGAGVTLLHYFVRSRDTSVLDEATGVFEAVLARDPSASAQSNLAECLRQQYGVRRDPAMLERALELARSAVADPADPQQARFQSNLALTLMSLPTAGGDPVVLAQARRAMWAALAATPAGHPNEAERKCTHAMVLQMIYRYEPQAFTLSDFLRAGRQAEQVTPEGHPLRATALRLRAAGDYLRAHATGNQAARSTSRRWFRQLIDNPALPVAERVRAAMVWADVTLVAGGDLHEARWAFGRTVELLPLVPGRHLRSTDQQQQIAQFPGLASDAAACAVATHDPAAALLLLEQGRGVLLAQAIETVPELGPLERARPDLAATFRRLRRQFGPSDRSEEGDTFGPIAAAEERRRAAQEWETLLTQIRAERGFTDFLRPPAIGELIAAGHDGPVVIVNISRLRCDAIILDRTQPTGPTGPQVLPMPHLTADEALGQARAFGEAIRAGRDPERSLAERAAAEDTSRAVLRWLWHAVTRPVLAALGLDRPPAEAVTPLPRIWWVPTGPLAFLPLHAAGEYPDPLDPTTSGPCALDLVVSSYVPTVRTLLHHRARLDRGPTGTPWTSLIVSMPTTPGAQPLPGAHAEATRIHHEIWPEADVLEGPAANRRSVLAALPTCSRAHFACHARSSDDPAGAAYLLLHDHDHAPLTVSDIAALRLTGAEFAYLSACETNRAAYALADEGMHLTSAFHVAGFRHVIGTLWRTADDVAARLAENCHRAVTTAGVAHAARALHAAVQDERHAAPSVPTLWAAHIHVGL